jgi:pimeloyl-ACP methyl ester carboxylesterase
VHHHDLPGTAHTADLDGPVAYHDFGGEGAAPLVMVHGIGGAAINWMLLAPLLTSRFHVLALDLPGFGESPLAGRSADLDSQALLVARFIEVVAGGPAILVGHSMGGLLTMLVGAGRPELVPRAVLFDPAFPPTRSPAPGLPGRVLDVLSSQPVLAGRLGGALVRVRGARRMVEESLRRTSAAGSVLPRGFIEVHVAAEAARMRRPGAYVGYMQGWRWFRDHFRDRHGLEEIIRKIRVPTLLLHGSADPVVLPDAAVRLASLQPAWVVKFMPGVGHNPNFEAPAESAELVLQWLGETSPA